MRYAAREKLQRYNAMLEGEERSALLRQMLGAVGDRVVIEPKLYFDYGLHVSMGSDVYINVGCVILDCAPIRIGNHVFMARTFSSTRRRIPPILWLEEP